MRRAAWPLLVLAGVTIGAMLAASLLQPVTWLQLTNADGTRIACTRVEETTPVTLAFTHSMFGGFVHEHYRVLPDGRLHRLRMVTGNAAAAEYYATDGQIRQTAEGYEVLAPPFVTDHLVIRVDARGRHQLTIGGTTDRLYEHLQASTAVTLEGKRSPQHAVPDMCRDGSFRDFEEQGHP